MKNVLSGDFSGMLDLQGIGNGQCDSFFNISNNVVTIIPLTRECKECALKLSYSDDSNDKSKWIYGFSEDSCSLAFVQTRPLARSISAPVDMGTSRFFTPIIVKSSRPEGIDVRTFDSIEFRSGIVDILHAPNKAIDIKFGSRNIEFVDKAVFTKEYEVEVNGEQFQLTYSVDTSDLNYEIGKVPDFSNAIHSVIRFNFRESKSLDKIEKYYTYAMKLFQFCTGRLNVSFEIRLYKKDTSNGSNIVRSSPIFVKLVDGFDDYANENLDITRVIRLEFLNDNLPALIKVLNEEKTQPHMLFLPRRNKDINNILYTDIGDICVAFEKEYSFQKKEIEQKNVEAASALAEELLLVIDSKSNCPDAVKRKAIDILNSNLKGYSPSLKHKINSLYNEFEPNIKRITEKEDHDVLKITKFYTSDEFYKAISKFVAMRNKASHSGIVWNEGVEIFTHLKLLIYFSILKRAGYSIENSAAILSWLFGHKF